MTSFLFKKVFNTRGFEVSIVSYTSPKLSPVIFPSIYDFFIVYSALYWFDSLCKKYINKKEYIDTEYEVKDDEEEET